MVKKIDVFELIVRRATQFTEASGISQSDTHPFEQRDIHPKLPKRCKDLFDDGYFSESTFEALKFLDKVVQKLAEENKSGQALMMSVFGGTPPKLPINPLKTQSDQDEQQGYKFIFAGIMSAIRNPKGHEFSITDNLDTCLEHLGLVTLLLRRLENSGYRIEI